MFPRFNINIFSDIGNGVDSFFHGAVHVIKGVVHGVTSFIGSALGTINSAIAGVVAKAISALFVSSALGKWLQAHNVTGTVFMVDSKHLNSTKTLSDLVANNPYGLVFPKSQIATFQSIITSLQQIFATFSITIFTITLIVAGMKLNESAILNNPQKRQEFMDMIIRFCIAWVMLLFLPYIVGLLLKFNGTILLCFQDFMMHFPVGTGKHATNLWNLALTVGNTVGGLTDQLKQPAGWIFTIIYLIINVIVSIGTYAYYLWREVAFIVLYLLAYIQIPALALTYRRENSFSRWLRAMIGTIFIQAINGFVITFIALFWKIAYEQLNGSLANIAKNFGIMLLIGVAMTMFFPLSKAIANQLDLSTNMVDYLNSNASSSAKLIAGSQVAMLGASASLLAGNAMVAGGLAQKGISNLGKLKDKINQNNNQTQDAFAQARRKHRLNELSNQGTDMIKKGVRQQANGVRGILGESMRYGLNSAGMRTRRASTSPLQALKNTLAGGVVSDKTKAQLEHGKHGKHILDDLGFASMYEWFKNHRNRNGNNNPQNTKMNGKRDANAHNTGVQDDLQGNQAHSNISNQVAKAQIVKRPETAYASVGALKKWAQGLTNTPIYENMQPNLDLSNPLTQSALHEELASLQAQNPDATMEDAEQGLMQEASSPHAIHQAMRDALRDTARSPLRSGFVNNDSVMHHFAQNLSQLGYSDNQIQELIHSNGVIPRETTYSNIDSNTTPTNNNNTVTDANSVAHVPTSINAGSAEHLTSQTANQPNQFIHHPQGASQHTTDTTPANQPLSSAYFTSQPLEVHHDLAPDKFDADYLQQHLAHDDSGNYAPDALQAHVSNDTSYITAKMQDGSQPVIASVGQGNPSLHGNDEYVRDLQFNPNYQPHTNTPFIIPSNDNGKLFSSDGNTAQSALIVTGSNAYVNSLLDKANHGSNYGGVVSSVPPINPMVDRTGQYTMQHLGAENGLSNYQLVGDNASSYIKAWDDYSNHGKGGWVRVSPMRQGIEDLGSGVTFTAPLDLQNNQFNLSQAHDFRFGKDTGATNRDYQTVNDWMKNIDFKNYIREVRLNPANFTKNHRGNQNLNMNDFSV